MKLELTDAERTNLGFHLACRLEDLERVYKKNGKPELMLKNIRDLEELTYTKIIPEAWSGPKPSYWKKGD